MSIHFDIRFVVRLAWLVLGLIPTHLFALAPAAPTNLKVVPIGANSFELSWQDNSNNETGWEIRTALPGAVPTRFDRITSANVTFKVVIFGSSFPGATVAFQVAAYNGSTGSEQFGLSPIVNGKALSPASFIAPSALAANIFTDGSVTLTWKDNARTEFGYEVDMKTGGAATANFVTLGTTSPGTVFNITIGGLDQATLYTFRVRAFTGTTTNVFTYTTYSNLVSVTTKPFQKPTNLLAKYSSNSSILLTWKDESATESSYDVEFREVGSTELSGGAIAADSQSVNITDLDLGKLYEFRIRASKGDLKTAFTDFVRLRIEDFFTSSLNPPIFFQTAFSFPVTTTRPEDLTNLTITGLPPGLTFDPITDTISGSASVEGVKIAKLTATFGSGYSIQRDLVLRIIRQPTAPLILQTFPPQTLVARRGVKLSILGKFSDPDTLNAQRVKTTLGDFDIILYPLATPATVQNFLTYLKVKRFNESFFHRSIKDFIIQGGGYSYSSKTTFTKLLKYPAVVNEAGVSNLRGTVAMAKFPDLPNSATSEFFVSTYDNAENLDGQNGGFTVFGRVPNRCMPVVDAINNLPVNNYNVSIAGVSQLLENLPLNTALPPPALNPAQLVKIISVLPVVPLTYQTASLNPAIATATLSGTTVIITGVVKGSTAVTVTATDLDGLTTTQSIPVTVN